ncbi:hypothetical protein WA026_011368 [Henosepilachna vigintioctopunctata]|uniref:Uncharacterized protein n=1 Tax=Henosepilachna vigintioctopunctata TaxID=420089 RepID=A0AAW1TKP1_9CUCU
MKQFISSLYRIAVVIHFLKGKQKEINKIEPDKTLESIQGWPCFHQVNRKRNPSKSNLHGFDGKFLYRCILVFAVSVAKRIGTKDETEMDCYAKQNISHSRFYSRNYRYVPQGNSFRNTKFALQNDEVNRNYNCL